MKKSNFHLCFKRLIIFQFIQSHEAKSRICVHLSLRLAGKPFSGWKGALFLCHFSSPLQMKSFIQIQVEENWGFKIPDLKREKNHEFCEALGRLLLAWHSSSSVPLKHRSLFFRGQLYRGTPEFQINTQILQMTGEGRGIPIFRVLPLLRAIQCEITDHHWFLQLHSSILWLSN